MEARKTRTVDSEFLTQSLMETFACKPWSSGTSTRQ